jgi:hypothetical protein
MFFLTKTRTSMQWVSAGPICCQIHSVEVFGEKRFVERFANRILLCRETREMVSLVLLFRLFGRFSASCFLKQHDNIILSRNSVKKYV